MTDLIVTVQVVTVVAVLGLTRVEDDAEVYFGTDTLKQ